VVGFPAVVSFGMSPSSFANDGDSNQLRAIHYLLPHLGHVRLGELRPEHLDRMYAAMMTRADGRLRAVATIRRVHATL